MGWLGPVRDTGILLYPKSFGVFPSFASGHFSSCKPVQAAEGRSLREPGGTRRSSPGTPLALPAARAGLAAGGIPTQSPIPHGSVCKGRVWSSGKKDVTCSRAPGQAVPAVACSPWLWDGYRNPCDVWCHFKSPAPGITGMWAHSSFLFSFLPSLILSCFQPSLRQAQKFDS